MFTIEKTDYVAAAAAVPLILRPVCCSLMVAVAFHSERRVCWLLEGRVLGEHSPAPFDEKDRRDWFVADRPLRSEVEAVDHLRRVWKGFVRVYSQFDKSVKKRNVFRLVRATGCAPGLRMLNSIPGVSINRRDPKTGEVRTYEQGELPDLGE
jgi:hypothetical protein